MWLTAVVLLGVIVVGWLWCRRRRPNDGSSPIGGHNAAAAWTPEVGEFVELRSRERRLRTLWSAHVAAAVLHGAQAVAAAVVLSTQSTQRGGVFTVSQQAFGRTRWSRSGTYLRWLVVAFPALSMVNHVVAAITQRPHDGGGGDGDGDGGWWSLAERERRVQQPNVWRWSEYAISAGVMVWLIAQLTGITSAPLLVVLILLNVALQFTGYLVERSPAEWGFSLLGWVLLVALWVPLVWTFFDSLAASRAEGRVVPTAIYAIVWLQLSLFAAFGVVSLYFRQRTNVRDCVRRELSYAGLSLAAKALLTWLVVGGALNAGRANTDPDPTVDGPTDDPAVPQSTGPQTTPNPQSTDPPLR